jgi:RNA polymerase primary sigma factor
MIKAKKNKEKKPVRINSSQNYLAKYLKEITQIPLLSREEEEKAARAAAAGDKAARDKLVNANLRFVVSIAKKYQGYGIPLEDLISEGNVGLVNAIDRFDVDKEYHFISYAVWWIRQSIISALFERSRLIRLPQNRAAELIKIKKARKMVQKQQSFDDEINEISDLLKMEKNHIKDLINISQDMISLDNSVSRDQNIPLKDYIADGQYTAPDTFAVQNILEANIEKILSTLEKHEAEILRCHYGLGNKPAMSLKEIGDMYNLSKERIRQIEEKAIARLQNPIRLKKLGMYVA